MVDEDSISDSSALNLVPSQLEVPLVGREPGVDNFRNGNATVFEDQRAQRLLAAVSCVAVDANGKEPFIHPITTRL
jgi:hypothetical protein